MATIIIDENTKKGKIIIDLIKEIGIGSIVYDSDYKPNQTTLDAIKEAEEGYTVKCSDFEDYLKKIK